MPRDIGDDRAASSVTESRRIMYASVAHFEEIAEDGICASKL